MSKGKTVAFPAARQPTANDWVSEATETQKPGGSETRKSGGKLVRLTIDLPEELHGQFKAACGKQRTKLRDEVLTFIEQWTKKHRERTARGRADAKANGIKFDRKPTLTPH